MCNAHQKNYIYIEFIPIHTKGPFSNYMVTIIISFKKVNLILFHFIPLTNKKLTWKKEKRNDPNIAQNWSLTMIS